MIILNGCINAKYMDNYTTPGVVICDFCNRYKNVDLQNNISNDFGLIRKNEGILTGLWTYNMVEYLYITNFMDYYNFIRPQIICKECYDIHSPICSFCNKDITILEGVYKCYMCLKYICWYCTSHVYPYIFSRKLKDIIIDIPKNKDGHLNRLDPTINYLCSFDYDRINMLLITGGDVLVGSQMWVNI